MAAVTIQSNKLVLNEVKDNQGLLQPSYRKNQMNFLANPTCVCCGVEGNLYLVCSVLLHSVHKLMG